ncbi:BMP2-like protein [Mya arenaria]|uniref:BMP2-like protein n=1 Tax=Mya arenaria TaxID=6604 RepID=A0ABY7DI14_MYAAR|nr:BMP2-like protein [Mya arenaria]
MNLGDLPLMEFPEYMNRSIWFDTSSRNIRYFFDIPTETDPNLDITSAIVRLHLKRREDCPCAYDSDHSTNRLHIKIYQYRKPIRSHARLNHRNMRLIDARMVTWDSARWVNLEVTEAVKRVMSRGRRNGGFEVHVRDMEENVLDAKTVIDPTVCSFTTDS